MEKEKRWKPESRIVFIQCRLWRKSWSNPDHQRWNEGTILNYFLEGCCISLLRDADRWTEKRSCGSCFHSGCIDWLLGRNPGQDSWPLSSPRKALWQLNPGLVLSMWVRPSSDNLAGLSAQWMVNTLVLFYLSTLQRNRCQLRMPVYVKVSSSPRWRRLADKAAEKNYVKIYNQVHKVAHTSLKTENYLICIWSGNGKHIDNELK